MLLYAKLPADYRLSMTYGSWRSPYCPDPRRFHATTLERLNEGAWFWVYIGHGYPLGADRVAGAGRALSDSRRRRRRPARMRSTGRRSPCFSPAMPGPSTPGATAWPRECSARRRPGGGGGRLASDHALWHGAFGPGPDARVFRRPLPDAGRSPPARQTGDVGQAGRPTTHAGVLDAVAAAFSPAARTTGRRAGRARAACSTCWAIRCCGCGIPGRSTWRSPRRRRPAIPLRWPAARRSTAGHHRVGRAARSPDLPAAGPRRSLRSRPRTGRIAAHYRRATIIGWRASKCRSAAASSPPIEAAGGGRRPLPRLRFVEGADDFALGSAVVQIAARSEEAAGVLTKSRIQGP